MNPLIKFVILSFLLAILPNSEVLAIMCRQCEVHDTDCTSGDVRESYCAPQYDTCTTIKIYFGRSQGTMRGCHVSTNETVYTEQCAYERLRSRHIALVCRHVCGWPACNGEQGTYMTSDYEGKRRRRSTRSRRMLSTETIASLKDRR